MVKVWLAVLLTLVCSCRKETNCGLPSVGANFWINVTASDTIYSTNTEFTFAVDTFLNDSRGRFVDLWPSDSLRYHLRVFKLVGNNPVPISESDFELAVNSGFVEFIPSINDNNYSFSFFSVYLNLDEERTSASFKLKFKNAGNYLIDLGLWRFELYRSHPCNKIIEYWPLFNYSKADSVSTTQKIYLNLSS